MAKILIVEDNQGTNKAICEYMKEAGHTLFSAFTGSEALKIFREKELDIIVLDIMLPEMSGIVVLHEIRKISNIPVIMLTALDDEYTQSNSFDEMADDYITKPFAIEELLARIRTALKKRIVTAKKDEDVIKCGLLSLDKMKHKVMYDNNEIELTNREFTLLQILMENKNIVLTRDVLIEKACGYDYIGETNVIDVYIRFLRTKIDDVFNTKIITTVRGVGYVIKDE